MLDSKSSSWLYPTPTGNPGRDRHARSVQFACLLLAFAFSTVAIIDLIQREFVHITQHVLTLAGLAVSVMLNRAGRWEWAARIVFLVLLVTATLLVFNAHDGFRSTSMLLFPATLLFSVMVLDRLSYRITVGLVLAAVAMLGAAEINGFTRAIPHVRSATTYDSVFFVDVTLFVFALIGSRIVRDSEENISELHSGIDRLSKTNLELRTAGNALREDEQQLVSIYETVRDVLFYLAVEPRGQFRFVSVNPAFLRVTGLSRDAVVGKIVNEVIPEPSLTMVLERYRQAVQEKGAISWEETSDYPNGRLTGEVTIAPVFDDNGSCTHLVGSVHDITDRRRSEAAMRESEERFRRVFEEGPLGLALVGTDNRFLKVNDALCHMVGYTESELARMSFTDITYRDDLASDVALAERLFKGEIPFFRLQKRYVKKTGETIWTNLTASLIRDRNGMPLYALSMIEDITERKRAQEEAFARQKLESIGVLANGIAHDFNNLMGAVLAQAELAMDELATGSPPNEQLDQIREAALRGSDIVRQLMVYAGQDDDVLEPVDMSAVVNEMLDLLTVTVSHHATLITDLGDALPAVKARAAQVRQIVMNLVANGSDAIEGREGVIRVTTKSVKVGPDMWSLTGEPLTSGDYVQLEVSDTGRGMSPETQARIFDTFFTTKSPGRGLGLAVVHGIVRSLDGAIHVESEPGHGTTFRILLPWAESDALAATGKTAPVDEAAIGVEHATVLVVEDEEALRFALKKMLLKKGFDVLEAANGAHAIELLRANTAKIDLLLLDLTIPGATCAEIVAQALQARPNLKIVVTSAYSENVVIAALSEFRVQSFVRKPFTFVDLVRILRKALAS